MRSTEEYINELPEEFRNKFDYSKSEYTGLKEPFNYVCPIHGQVTMKAGKHSVSKHGCNYCATDEGTKAKMVKGARGSLRNAKSYMETQ